MKIFHLCVLLIVAWVVMTLTHEGGHLLGGWLGGATLTDWELRPWRLPYSLHAPDPFPLLTLWSGPLLGVLLPLLVAALVRHPSVWFVTDFCLLANGVYLAAAWWSDDRLLDTTRLLDAGASPVAIAVFCLITIALGYKWFREDCIGLLSSSSANGDSEQPR